MDRIVVRLALLHALFLMPTSAQPIFGWQRLTSPDSPFADYLGSYSTVLKESKEATKLFFSSYIDENCCIVPLEKDKSEVELEEKKQKQLFGYKLCIQYLKDTKNSEHKRPTLFFHGWQNNGRSVKVVKRYCKVLPGDVVTFDFPDAGAIIAPFWKSSFGQLPDVLPALYALNYVVKKQNLKSIDLFGISRGGAAIINMIAVLYDNDLFDKYRPQLERIGITYKDRKKLLDVIKRGSIVLDTPLRSMKEAVAPLWAVSAFTQYQKNSLDPVETARLISGMKLKILVHFQHGDRVVYNTNEDSYFKNLAEKNLKNTYLVVGNDGGHLHTHAALSQSISLFKKLAGSTSNQERDKIHGPIRVINNPAMKLEEGRLTRFTKLEYISPTIAGYHHTLDKQHAYKKRPKNYLPKKQFRDNFVEI